MKEVEKNLFIEKLVYSAEKCKHVEQRRTPWSCGLIRHVLDPEVGGLNLAAAKFWVKNETTVWKTNDWVKNETTVSNDWVKNETTV